MLVRGDNIQKYMTQGEVVFFVKVLNPHITLGFREQNIQNIQKYIGDTHYLNITREGCMLIPLIAIIFEGTSIVLGSVCVCVCVGAVFLYFLYVLFEKRTVLRGLRRSTKNTTLYEVIFDFVVFDDFRAKLRKVHWV